MLGRVKQQALIVNGGEKLDCSLVLQRRIAEPCCLTLRMSSHESSYSGKTVQRQSVARFNFLAGITSPVNPSL